MATKGYASYLIAGKQTNWNTVINNDEFNGIIYEFMSSSLKNNSTPITPTRFKGNASPMPQIENFLSAEGDIQFNLHADNMVMWLAQMLMDDMSDNPVVGDWTEVFGDGMGEGKAWTFDEELDDQPGDVDQEPGRLRFTFSDDVTLSVIIFGTNANDKAIMETLVFDDEDIKTTIQYFKTVNGMDFSIEPPGDETVLIECSKEKPGDVVEPEWLEVFGNTEGGGKAWTDPDNLDTQPGALTPSQAPALLKFTFGANDTIQVDITGTDQNDTVIEETLTFANETTKTTTKYFKTVTEIDFTNEAGGGETLFIEASKNVYIHTIDLKDDILPGLTIEEVKGALPSTYVGCLVNQGTFELGDIITMTLALMAKRGWNSYICKSTGNEVEVSETPTDVSSFDRVSQEIFPAWGMALEINGAGNPTPIGSMTLVINNQLVNPSTRFRNDRTLPKPVRNDNRDITLTCNIDYDSDNNDWDEKFETMQEASAILYCYRKPHAGPELKITFTLPRCQIGAYPDPAVTDYAEVLQEIILRPIRTENATDSDELSITVQCLADE